MQTGAEGHARIERDDDVVGCPLVVAPGGLDDDAPPQAHDREVLLPGAGPVLLVDLAHLQLPDGTQVEGGEVTQALSSHRDGGLGGAHVEGRQVSTDGDRGVEDGRSRQALLLGAEGLLHGDATGGRAQRISLTASTASWSHSMESSSQVPAADVPSSAPTGAGSLSFTLS